MPTITTSASPRSTSRTSTTPTTPTAANVDPNALPGYFLDTDQVGEAMGSRDMVAVPVENDMISGVFSGPEGC